MEPSTKLHTILPRSWLDVVSSPIGWVRGFLRSHRSLRLFVREIPGPLGLLILLSFITLAILASQVAPYDPQKIQIGRRLVPPMWTPDGSPANILGTDVLGRDMLSRIIFGTRLSLVIAFATATLSGLAGVTIGLCTGYFKGRGSEAVMRAIDVQYALPWLVLAIVIIAIVGPSLTSLIVTLSLWTWVPFARVVRATTLSAREEVYVEAARTLGAGAWRIIARHILPNIFSPIVIVWSFTVAQVIIGESALSFLGLGVQPPTPSWGNMVGDGRAYVTDAWWVVTLPGLAIMLAVLAVNLVGDALRDALDPRLVSAKR